MINLSVQIGNLALRNPVIAASGTFGFGQEYSQLYDTSRLGAICTKGLTLHPQQGNPGPRLWETPCGLLNSIGLQNPGVTSFVEEDLPKMKEMGLVVIANVWGNTVKEYGQVVRKLSNTSVDAIEINISCPNIPGQPITGEQIARTARVVREARKACKKPLWVKLSPTGEGSSLQLARAIQAEGANAVCAANTFRAMAIDITKRKPVFRNIFAGLSGPAIKPITLGIVYELSLALEIPVIGVGGITNWQDAVEFIMAGAYAVQIGTANFIDPFCGIKITEGLTTFVENESIKSWEDIRGCAHQ
ncbi:MAG: dihydroorotate dehydrogenase [Dehalococcoidia bacterium]|nr:dihydroorotate dehydrogenase [Dehalococcoidia bacterium]